MTIGPSSLGMEEHCTTLLYYEVLHRISDLHAEEQLLN